MFDDEIELGRLVEKKEYGEALQSKEWEPRLANQLNDQRSEFYQATRSGLKPELTFEINDFEYDNEQFIRYKGKEYTIIRAAKRDDMRELVCTTHTGVGYNGSQAETI